MTEPTLQELAARQQEMDRRYTEVIKALSVRIEQRFDAEQRALINAREEIAHRLETMNEFRAQILNERGSFVNRDLFEARSQQLENRTIEQGAEIQKLRSVVNGMYAAIAFVGATILAQILSDVW